MDTYFEASSNDSIGAEIYRKIKTDILNGNIEDSALLVLTELAAKYNVSKTPIRDALNTLEQEGYLRVLPRKGYLLIPITQKAVREYFQVRLVLEKAAVALAVQTASDEELEQLLKMAISLSKSERECRFDDVYRANNEFHRTLMMLAHNLVMSRMNMWAMENISRILMADTQRVDTAFEKNEHVEIAKALCLRDAALAEVLIESHITKVQNRLQNWR